MKRGNSTAGLPVWWVSLLPALALGIMAASGNRLPDDPLQGRTLFESKSCIQCHGIAGKGPGIGPNLGDGGFQGTFLDLGAALWNHVPGMSVSFERNRIPWPELSEGEAAQLMAFLYFIDYLGRPGVAAEGRKVFQAGGCASCHVIGGGRGGAGPDLREPSRFASPLYVAQEIWNHGPPMLESMRRMNIAPPVFEEGDLADLSAFVRQEAGPGPRKPLLSAPGSPNRGREVFSDLGCSKCHGREGRGGSGPDLGNFRRRSAEAIASTMWNHALAMRDAMRAEGIGWPRFKNTQLADLVAFLYFLPFADPPGDPGWGANVFQRSCADCHRQRAGPIQDSEWAPAPDLIDSRAFGSPAAMVAAMWSHSPIMREAIVGQGRPWPELTGSDLRDLRAYLSDLSSKKGR